jgi:hypothetical protein
MATAIVRNGSARKASASLIPTIQIITANAAITTSPKKSNFPINRIQVLMQIINVFVIEHK